MRAGTGRVRARDGRRPGGYSRVVRIVPPPNPMTPSPVPIDDAARVRALRRLQLLDTPPEERFDRLTRLAKRLFDVPIALVNLVDAHRVWIKSNQGLADAVEAPRDVAFCSHAIVGDDLLLVPDATRDVRFADNPFVTGAPDVRFYAGCPLRLPNGHTVGVLCLLDREPRTLDDEQRSLLRDLAGMAEQELVSLQLATTDPLTGLSNRRGFELLSRYALATCRRLRRPVTALFFDLDGLKQVNDTRGHAEGDRVLVEFASMLRTVHRESDVVGRFGGDEFVVLLTGADADSAAICVRRLEAMVEARRPTTGAPSGTFGFSVGAVAYSPQRHDSIEALLAEADAAMYEHKVSRRPRASA